MKLPQATYGARGWNRIWILGIASAVVALAVVLWSAGSGGKETHTPVDDYVASVQRGDFASACEDARHAATFNAGRGDPALQQGWQAIAQAVCARNPGAVVASNVR